MMHVNVKAPKGAIYETPAQAIQHIWLYGLFPQRHWPEIEAAARAAGVLDIAPADTREGETSHA